MDLCIRKSKKSRAGEGRPRIKCGSLMLVSALEVEVKVAGLGVWESRGDVDVMWDKAASCIRETARELIESKEEEEKRVIREAYKVTRSKAKLPVTAAKTAAFESLYAGLEEKGEKNRLYRLAKARERKERDLNQVKCIKGEDGRVLVEHGHIKKRCRSIFIDF
ncbi:uncharacterized protein LOC124886536 [Capsicum annuum]|uniref:uncharacterized protein LOC124886536 n=1 Tax=Capsicum annuum TaxID=4072 RepID=UPI001FB0F940|nr:uncharacterized protein LOC124886536 [Capsicum annuum]